MNGWSLAWFDHVRRVGMIVGSGSPVAEPVSFFAGVLLAGGSGFGEDPKFHATRGTMPRRSTFDGTRPYRDGDKAGSSQADEQQGDCRMERGRAVEDLEVFLAERGEPLLRAAVLLTGSQEAGEDLLQAALERVLGRWRTIHGSPEAYLRRTLYNLAADDWRHQGARRKVLGLLRAAQPGVVGDRTEEVDLRDALIRLLLQLPPRQRAVIVLRYWEQLTETESAEVLGCSVGTIKAAASRGLARMRELSIGQWDAQAQPEREATA